MLTSMILAAAAAFGGGGQQQAPACKVTDAKGQVLAPTTQDVRRDGSALVLTASSDVFAYTVTVSAEKGILDLTDKRSGDRAVLEEGEFSPHEAVAVKLITDEAPDDALKLECVQP